MSLEELQILKSGTQLLPSVDLGDLNRTATTREDPDDSVLVLEVQEDSCGQVLVLATKGQDIDVLVLEATMGTRRRYE
jgi:hypothetical protein